MTKSIQNLNLECFSCGHTGKVEAATLEKKLAEPPTYKNIAELWKFFSCSSCGAKIVSFSDQDNVLLFDPANMRKCMECELPILFPRIQLLPDTALCLACADEGEKPEKPSPYPTPPPELSKCTRCGSPSVVRENSKDGHYFIGCTAFPRCRWTQELPEGRIK